jgi:hypothetical protein
MGGTDRALLGVLLGCVAVWGTSRALPAAAWLAVVSVLLGGAITACLAWYFYQSASRELKDEAAALREESERLRHHTTLIVRGLEDAGLAESSRDERGEIEGMVIKLGDVAGGRSGDPDTLSVGDEGALPRRSRTAITPVQHL